MAATVAASLAATGASVAAAAPAAAASITLEAERLTLAGAGQVFTDAAASGGKALAMWGNGVASGSVVTGAADTLRVVARGDQWKGAPKLTLSVDGKTVLSTAVTAEGWTTYSVTGSWAAGRHRVRAAFSGDAWGGVVTADRNLYLDAVTFSAGSTTAPAAPAPLNLYDAPGAVDGFVKAHPELARIADTPTGIWMGEWVADPYAAVRAHVAAAGGKTLPLVVYAVPNRDNGGYSAGGFATAAQYQAWVGALAAGIGTAKAIVVLEPDALGLSRNFGDEGARAERRRMLATAVDTLKKQPNVKVYIDASMWVPAQEMANLLLAAGLQRADGFSINVSAFNPLTASYAYGDAVSAAAGGKHYVVDTSRNGVASSGGEWCNPAGQGLGLTPRLPTGHPAADALLWVKRPGESDGTCNGGPSAGTFWVSYAQGLVARAVS